MTAKVVLLHEIPYMEHAGWTGVLAAAVTQDVSLVVQVVPPVAPQMDPANKQVETLSAAKQRKPSGVTGLQAQRPVTPMQFTPDVAQRASSAVGATPHKYLGPA